MSSWDHYEKQSLPLCCACPVAAEFRLKSEAAKAIEDKELHITALVKSMLLRTADGTLKREELTPEAASAIFPDRIKEASAFLKSLGELRSIELLRRNEENSVRAYSYRVAYQTRSLICQVSLTQENKFAGIGMRPE